MTILLTGATGYIGRRLLPLLLEAGHDIICVVRDPLRFSVEEFPSRRLNQITVLRADLTDAASLPNVQTDIDAAFYLVHSMTSAKAKFKDQEELSAINFLQLLTGTHVGQIIYLGGIVNDENLSEHLTSRKHVETVLQSSPIPVTVLRAAIIIGSGSASFEIIRDLVEKLPIMVGPKWLNSKCQPIAIRNVLEYLMGVLLNKKLYGKTFDVGGPDILTYHEMLDAYAEERKLKRWIIKVPLLSPRLSSLWLYFVTSTAFPLARNLVNSLRNDVICKDNSIHDIIPLDLLSYRQALLLAFDKIKQNSIISSWKDSITNYRFDADFSNYIQVPEHGCFTDKRSVILKGTTDDAIEKIWTIGGARGWYYGDWLWNIRGIVDKIVGGVGLRRGRRSAVDLKEGDALDFWRVLVADKKKGRLLLFAEMKLPGEAWLEFQIKTIDGKPTLCQTATFRPLGIWGRIYWYAVLPFHGFIFPHMAQNIGHN